MNLEELTGFLRLLKQSYPVLNELLSREPILQRWAERLQDFSSEETSDAFCRWMDSHHGTPSLDQVVDLCEQVQRDNKKEAQRRADEASYESLSEKAALRWGNDSSGRPLTDADKAWMAFHKYWLNRILNYGIVRSFHVQGKDVQSKSFPLDELVQGYRALRQQWPELATACDSALALHGTQ